MSFVPHFHIQVRRGSPDAVTLALVGELDLVAAPTLMVRLGALVDDHADIALDLSELAFIDAAGLSALIRTVTSVRQSGRGLTIHRRLSPQVRLLLEVVDAGGLIWPDRPPVS